MRCPFPMNCLSSTCRLTLIPGGWSANRKLARDGARGDNWRCPLNGLLARVTSGLPVTRDLSKPMGGNRFYRYASEYPAHASGIARLINPQVEVAASAGSFL